jgi:multidrug resistance efflux pump
MAVRPALPRLARLVITSVAVVILLSAILGWRSRAISAPPDPIVGVVHQTEIRIAPEASGRLLSVKVQSGEQVRRGQILAVLESPELSASVDEAKANAAASRADRANVEAGVRAEEVKIAAQRVRVADANLVLAQKQLVRTSTLARKDFESKQQLDESTNAVEQAKATLAQAQATYAQSKTGPTSEERAIAAAKVALAEATVADLDAQFAKTILVAPVDGVVGILVAELGEAISTGQPVLTLEAEHQRWFTFTVREDRLGDMSIGAPVTLLTTTGDHLEARVTELRPLGEFAVWRAARAVGDHDVNSFLVRADPVKATPNLEPGMTVWIEQTRRTDLSRPAP